VARQYCGELGKVENCQAGVFLGYASSRGYTLLDRRLYLPEQWFSEDYQAKREKCGIPADASFKSKSTPALEMVSRQAELAVLPYRWLCCDEFFGRDGAFLEALGSYGWYLAEAPSDSRVYLAAPLTGVSAWSGRGRPPGKERVLAGQARTVAEIAASLPLEAWQRFTLKEGSKGPLVALLACVEVHVVRRQGETLVVRQQRLLLRREPASGKAKHYLSNAPKATPLATYARISVMRWPIESCFEEGKQELGMGDYQVRSYKGWHHHMTLVILAHFFLVRLKLRLTEKAPKLTLPQAVMLFKASLPQPEFDLDKAIRIVNYYQERHEAARQSHRKKRLARLGAWLE
jgi:SRSO17 transposase